MTKTPAAPKKAAPIKSTAGKALEAAAKPVEALERAIKRATTKQKPEAAPKAEAEK